VKCLDDLNQSNIQAQSTTINDPVFVQIANFANVLFLIGQTVSVTTKDVKVIESAILVKLFCGVLFILASVLEANEQQIAPGVTTEANRLKVSGSIISIIGSLILTRAFYIEERLKQQGVSFPTATVTPFIAGTSAITI
jgi:hypothetical protein